MAEIIYKTADGEVRLSHYQERIELGEQSVITPLDLPKDKLYLTLHHAFEKGIIPILYDKNIHSIQTRIDNLNVEKLPETSRIVFFTSGTTGEPTGAIKSEANILKELAVLKKLFEPFYFERMIVTVPLIHIYGFLAGVMLPKALSVDVILKEEFLPHELLELAEEKRTLCVTNPVFLKVLNKLPLTRTYPHITFLSSTGKLERDTIQALQKKLATSIYQLFGSTETGGIAYKVNDALLWRPLDGVTIAQSHQNLSVQSPYVSDFLIEKGIKTIAQPFITTDIIEMEEGGFKLLGRDSEIIKISGKRISILEIERLLEESAMIDEAWVKLVYGANSYKDEQLMIHAVTSYEVNRLKKEIQTILHHHYTNMNIRTTIHRVKSIPKNPMGKKVRR